MDDETGPSVGVRIDVWNTCQKSGGVGVLGGVLGYSFLYKL